ncbi:site-2 protease family protein [Bacteriovorax sp. Seq25_V]|uniref:site-2 protease family protein n=1 Tax=Bacteriovorax sp. Seq25_V TaxID=1201288 RepID=UPI00038A1B36|nr:site-2 protease family protein [Bacteriovorax sp. Seq25_V]EQC44707.1 peptidase, M50 family [Bacteriovorax sp. Seq25_V]
MDISLFIEKLALCLPGFLFAIVIHEAGHAWMAMKFGDDTAKYQGRLTLNPAVHYDLVGTIIFPLIGLMIGPIPFGWAKPVPVDPRRFRNMKAGIFWVSFAGPGANILMALVSTFLFALFYTQLPLDFIVRKELIKMSEYSVLINIVLAVFNLIPFPPLDGSKMVSTFLDYNMARKYEELQRYSFVFILLLWFTNIFSYLLQPALYLGYAAMNLFVWMMG